MQLGVPPLYVGENRLALGWTLSAALSAPFHLLFTGRSLTVLRAATLVQAINCCTDCCLSTVIAQWGRRTAVWAATYWLEVIELGEPLEVPLGAGIGHRFDDLHKYLKYGLDIAPDMSSVTTAYVILQLLDPVQQLRHAVEQLIGRVHHLPSDVTLGILESDIEPELVPGNGLHDGVAESHDAGTAVVVQLFGDDATRPHELLLEGVERQVVAYHGFSRTFWLQPSYSSLLLDAAECEGVAHHG